MQHVGFAFFRIEIARRFERQPGADGARSVAKEDSGMVQVTAIAGLDRQAGMGTNPGMHQGVMHGARGQRHRDGEQLGASSRLGDGAIAEQQNGGPAAHQVNGARAQIVDRPAQVAGWRKDAVQNRQRHLVGQGMLAIAQRMHLAQGEERRLQRKAGNARIGIQQVRPGAETGVQLDDNGLAHRVDGRIGDLGKALAEEGIDRPRRMGQGRQRRIVAHGPNRVLAVAGHRGQHHADIFPGIAESLLQLGQILQRRGEGGRLQRSILHQRAVGGEAVEFLQQLIVFEQLVRIQVGDQHFARTEAATMDDSLRIKVHQAGFRSGDHQRIFGQEEAAGAQAIAVQGHAHQVTVGKGQRRRAIPGLNAIRVVAKKSRVLLPAGGRQQHSDRFCDTAAVARQQLDHLVEAGRIGSVLLVRMG